jgi:hypothetical protein
VRRQDLSETLPLLAIETHELHLLDRHMVVGRRIDLMPGNSTAIFVAFNFSTACLA